MRKIRPSEEWPVNLKMATAAPRLNEGGLEAIESWIAMAENPRLLIVDTLATVRLIQSGRDNIYQADYGAMRDLHQIASKHRIAVVVIHHVRKADADDPFDTVSGSTGLTGAADATLILTRASKASLSPEQLGKLEVIDFVWDATRSKT
jgi:RecA-family ATPase